MISEPKVMSSCCSNSLNYGFFIVVMQQCMCHLKMNSLLSSFVSWLWLRGERPPLCTYYVLHILYQHSITSVCLCLKRKRGLTNMSVINVGGSEVNGN